MSIEYVLDHTKRHHRFFEEMTRIPHGSYHEKQYSDYLAAFARDHGFNYVQDAMGNVVIYKPASPGYEGHPPVAIQSHMDMVWEKDEGYEHDFEKDPLKLYIEDGYLIAEHTTLGADDGTGVAFTLAILDDPDAKHPPIEAVFTVQEEVGMFGAQALDKNLLHAARLISLDCGGGDSIYISSLGGRTAELCHPLKRERTSVPAWRLTVSSLNGEYSSGYLKGADNAIRLCAEGVSRLSEKVDVRIVSINGGKEGSKTAAHCEAVFCSAASKEQLYPVFADWSETVKKELSFGEPNCELTLEPALTEECLVLEDSETILTFLTLLPVGATIIKGRVPNEIGGVVSWTQVETGADRLMLRCGLRGDSNYKLDRLYAQEKTLCDLLGFTIENETGFPAWEYNPNSQLYSILKRVFLEQMGKEPTTIEVQGGLECSIFYTIRTDMDIITLGPVGQFVHTTRERLQLKSFDAIYDIFVRFLEAL